MTDPTLHNPNEGHGLRGWLLFPLSLYPLVALMTYDWHAVHALVVPSAASTNWVGPLGNAFAYHCYQLFGLAAWLIPIICVLLGLCLVLGRRVGGVRRTLWFAVCLSSAAGLLQILQNHSSSIVLLSERLNIAGNAGGAVGYLALTCGLSRLLSDIGAGLVAFIVLVASLIALIGAHNLLELSRALARWILGREDLPPAPSPDDPDYAEQAAAYQAAVEARDAARRERLAAKERARAEKEAARQRREAEKEAARQQRREQEQREAAERATAVPVATVPTAVPATVPRRTARPAVPPAASSEEDAPEKPDEPYLLPPVSLLNPVPKSSADHGDVGEMSQRLIDTLLLFNVEAKLDYTVQGPVVTKYAIELKPGTKYSAVTNISSELMGALHAKSLRIEAPIPGQDRVGIEVPNKTAAGISFREIFESETWRQNVNPRDGKPAKYQLPLLFGKDAAGRELVADLASMPHMLVAGATGQGKSVCLNSLICGLLMSRTPEELKFIMVDPKSVEFTPYAAIPHLIVPVITENKKVVFSLHWAVAEMEKRLKLFARARVKNIFDYNHRPQLTQIDMFGNDSAIGSDMPRTVPYIVIIIDEAADLIGQCGKEVNPDIQRLTQKARAAGIHLILATQRPDAKIITGTIKANIPGRVAFKTSSSIDSRTILDETGAENLIGKGDMLFRGKDNNLTRAQGAWISDADIDRVTDYIQQHAATQFDERFTKKLGTIKEAEIDPFADNDEDADADKDAERETREAARAKVKAEASANDFKKAIACIINTKRASISHFQRQMGWGYNHSAKIMDQLEAAGIIGPQSGAGPRQIILDQAQLEEILNSAEGSTEGGVPAGDEPEDLEPEEPEA